MPNNNIIDWEHQIFINQVKRLFVPFTGIYEKIYYDIQLPDWTIIEHCWPNAWKIWPETGKQYWPWECLIRISRFYPWEPTEYKEREEQKLWIDILRLKVISDIDTIMTTFWEVTAYKHIQKILYEFRSTVEIEQLRRIVKNSNPIVLHLFFIILFDWTDLGFWLALFQQFKFLLENWEPAALKKILERRTLIPKHIIWTNRLKQKKYEKYQLLVKYQKELQDKLSK